MSEETATKASSQPFAPENATIPKSTSAESAVAETEPTSTDLTAEFAAEKARWEAERAELNDRLLRALAELENFRKRAERDRREAMLYGASKFARDILSVYDHLSRALAHSGEDARENLLAVIEGVDLTLRELTNVLSRHGVERINPEPGTPFDPHQHEAIVQTHATGFPPGAVVQVVLEGFRMHDQLLRPAKVVVASKGA